MTLSMAVMEVLRRINLRVLVLYPCSSTCEKLVSPHIVNDTGNNDYYGHWIKTVVEHHGNLVYYNSISHYRHRSPHHPADRMMILQKAIAAAPNDFQI